MTELVADARNTAVSADVAREEEALDAYSTIVTSIAQRVLPQVASLRVSHRSRDGREGAAMGRAWRSRRTGSCLRRPTSSPARLVRRHRSPTGASWRRRS